MPASNHWHAKKTPQQRPNTDWLFNIVGLIRDFFFFLFMQHKIKFPMTLHRDVYHNIEALDPEKLNVFRTVREITGEFDYSYIIPQKILGQNFVKEWMNLIHSYFHPPFSRCKNWCCHIHCVYMWLQCVCVCLCASRLPPPLRPPRLSTARTDITA